MCYPYSANDQASNGCPMCKVFPHARCPHIRDVCRNRAVHPRLDVLYLKNAEVDCFNGCGYCKWSRMSPPPPPKSAGYHNPGWPGCCRPPSTNEHRMIQAADWRSVSIVHQIPIPVDVKAVLESFAPRPGSGPASPNGNRGTTPRMTLTERKNSTGSPPTKKGTAAVSIPIKGRAGTSPSSRSSSAVSTSVPVSSSLEQNIRRSKEIESRDKHAASVHSSPSHKHLDLEIPVTPRRNSSSRMPQPSAATSTVSVSKVTVDSRSQSSQSPERRRPPASVPSSPLPPVRPALISRPSDRQPSSVGGKKDDNISSASSSSGSGSMTDSTVTSDGGFTDYLSDESEEELQRQAEARAALVAQNQAEEQEFKAARQQLAHVDLRPPKTWNPTNLTNSTVARVPVAQVRSQG